MKKTFLFLFLTFSFFLKGDIEEPKGVCPPFYLKDEEGKVINTVENINADKPYSPKQTCSGKDCHNYEKIVEGFHFMQGKGEKLPEVFKKRYNWVLSPGNYGGTWCSPAPLYKQLAPKKNENPRMIDMTSFDFITSTCGYCHPGGGPLEYDREGNRYDKYMKEKGMVSGGENGFDGDYYKARWIETGVLEADCLLCHLPEYNFKERNKQIDNLNFKWAATAGSGFGKVEGSIKENIPVKVTYDLSKFDKDGTVLPHIVLEPRNSTCLACHSKPGWKKRGASFSPRTDVHIRAGLKCVDCHPAGSMAQDKRVKGKEVHQIGKGDDPSGNVRNDLDNTCLDCSFCHSNGYLGAPIAKHKDIPIHHFDKISCQGCHIPIRFVKSAQVQVSDVYNKAPKISPPPKRIWTFYDQNLKWWNHYGELNMFTKEDQPLNPYTPVLFKYKGKIYPGNRVHSAWIGYFEEGKEGLNQFFMKDIYNMWQKYFENNSNYPLLSKIKDDTGDGIPEVNSGDEIEAIINSVKKYLEDTNFDLKGKKVVWVSDDLVYFSKDEFKKIEKFDWEASPYASVYKFSHDVSPAKAALGSKGCSDCHSKTSNFFNAKVLKYPFDKEGKPVFINQAEILGYTKIPKGKRPFTIFISYFFKYLTIIVMAGLIIHIILDSINYYRRRKKIES
jgi:hypothetical protein